MKLIDAAQPLSVPVHPSDAYALKNENSDGKTEMWYIVEANERAGIYLGFKRNTSEEEIRSAIESDRLEELLNFVPVKKGECYFIPAGTVHAIGAGCLICEVQQNSNLTYRLYDYGRRDANGNTRELHVEKALAVIAPTPYRALGEFLPTVGERTLGLSRYFHASLVSLSGEHTLHVDEGSFLALFCVDGAGSVGGESVTLGDSLLLTAGSGDVSLKGNATFVAVSVRKYTVASFDGGYQITDDLGRVHARARTREELLSKYALTKEDFEKC